MDYRRVGASALGANGGPGLLRPWGDPPPDPVALLGTETGLHWEDELGHWCLLTHVVSGLPRAGRGEQTRAVLKKLDGDLEWVKLGFGDVLRTWFFLDDILAWYAEFNQVRTRFLADRGQRAVDLAPAATVI